MSANWKAVKEESFAVIEPATPAMSDPTTGPSSSPRPSRPGSRLSAHKRPTSHRAARGRTAISSFNSKLRDELLNGEIFYSL